jgi:hypothetical protein
MRSSLKKTVIASLAALSLGLGVISTAAPASAHAIWPHGGGGGWHGGGHGWHGGHGWGPAAGIGLLGALAVGAVVASQYNNDDCVQYRPTYDAWGNYVGRRPVNIC